jgi:hypothetical protein
MSETRSLVSFGPIANLARSAGKPAYIFSFLQIQRTPIASKPASMLGLRVVQGGLLSMCGECACGEFYIATRDTG